MGYCGNQIQWRISLIDFLILLICCTLGFLSPATPLISFGMSSIGSKVKAVAAPEFLFFKSEKAGFGRSTLEPRGS